ncbi:hypothetical protein ACVDFE_11150 [Lentzea chajnantorensis]
MLPDLARALCLKVAAYAGEAHRSPAAAFGSRHLEDLAFLTSLVDDADVLLEQLGPPPANGRFAQASVLDEPEHHAWRAVGDDAEDARLTWDLLRHGD